MIEHIVFSGGALSGIYEYGALVYLYEHGFWNRKELKSLYGTSIGAILSVFICLDEDFKSISHYLIHRPWLKALNISAESIIGLYESKGLFDVQMLHILLDYWFEHKKWSKHMTLKELYNETHIDLYMYTVKVNTLEVVELSHHTHPDIEIFVALSMTTCIPVCFKPIWYKNEFYIDGGIKCNYPIQYCTDRVHNIETILGFHVFIDKNVNIFTENMNLIKYLLEFIRNCMHEISVKQNTVSTVKYQVQIPCILYQDYSIDILKDSQIRENLIQQGKQYGESFLNIFKKEQHE